MTEIIPRLLAALEERANSRGLAFARELWLLRRLECSRSDLDHALRQLVEGGAIRILSPFPFLAIRLLRWPNRREKSVHIAPSGYSYKSSLSQSRLIKDSYSPKDSDEALLQEILTTLGETDPTTFRGAIKAFRPEAIRATLERVRRMKRIT